MKRHLMLMVSILALVLSGCALGTRTQWAINRSEQQLAPIPPAAAESDKPIGTVKVTAEDFAKDFELNKVRANDYYKVRIVRLTGVIARVAPYSHSLTEVVLRTKADAPEHFEFVFDDSQRKKLHKLQRGKKATVSGRFMATKSGGMYFFRGLVVH